MKIFNVDDDPMIRTLVREILEAEAFEVISAANGDEAFALLQSMEKPLTVGLFVLDVEMPGMSGLEIAAKLKTQAQTRNIPVIMLTCQSAPEDFMSGYNAGADYYITKPFTREQLLYGIKLVTAK